MYIYNTSDMLTFCIINNDYGNPKNHTRRCSDMDISFLFKYTSFIQFYFIYTLNSSKRTNTDLIRTCVRILT